MRRWVARSSCVAVSLAAGLLIGEGVVRAAGLGNATLTRGSLHAFHAEAGWMGLPGCDTHYELPGVFDVRVLCNSAGLRDRERSLAKPAGSRRVAVLGDSFMWGYGVENGEMFSSRLEHLLADTEVLNFGANGYSTVQELVRLEADALAYAPDVAIVSFCSNDLGDNLDDKEGGRPAATLGDDGEVRIVNRPVRTAWKSGAKQWLRHNSRLFAAVEYETEAVRLRHKMQARADASASDRPRPGETRATDDEQAEPEFTLLDLFGRPSSEIDRAWRVERELLAAIRDRMAKRGGRLLVVFVAMKEARSEQAFRKTVVAPFERPDLTLDVDRDRPGRRLAAICDELGVPFLDLNPVFRSHEQPDVLFLRRNAHWSAAGHALAAQAVARRLAECELAVPRQPGAISR